MAIFHADNFSIYGNNGVNNPGLVMVNGVYAEANCTLVSDPDGVSGGYVMGWL